MSDRAPNRAIFLDRDGVLIEAVVRENRPYAATSPEEVHIIHGVREACAELASLGYLLVLTTNQPDIARGKIGRSFVEETNAMLVEALRLDSVQLCDHDNAHNCICRKPKPGLMTQAAAEHAIDLSKSLVVGDRWRDIEAGRAAGCKTVFIDYGYDEALVSAPDYVCASLLDAVAWIRDQSTGI